MFRRTRTTGGRRPRTGAIAVVLGATVVAGGLALLVQQGDVGWLGQPTGSIEHLPRLVLPTPPLGGHGPTPAPSPQPGSGPTPTPTPAGGGQGLKPVLAGLLDRQAPPPTSYNSVVTGWVVDVNWADLQPQPFGPISSGNAIDAAIARARQMEAQLSRPVLLKLRVFAGMHEPDWVKSLGGAPMTLNDGFDGKSGTMGRWWTDAFAQAYQDLQNKLAAQYDSVAEIAETVVSRCSMFYPEPLLRSVSVRSNVSTLLAAGYSVSADLQCQRQQIDETRAAWHRTRIGMAFNPYQDVNSDGTVNGEDEATTNQLLQYFRQDLGAQGVFENYSIRDHSQGPQYDQMYGEMQSLSGPMSLQTAVAARVGDLGTTLDRSIGYGACSVELPAPYAPTYSPSYLQPYNQRLQQQASGT